MRTNPEKTNHWLQHIQSLKESGLSRRSYCERNQVKLSALGYRCQKLNSSAKASNKARKAGWIPVQISEDDLSKIDLRIGKVIIAIKSGFDPSLLADLLRTISALC